MKFTASGLAGASTPLGIPANFVDRKRRDTDFSGGAWRLLRSASTIMPAERVAACHKYMTGGESLVRQMRNTKTGKCSFWGVQTCGSVWMCPICAPKIATRRRTELASLLSWAEGEGLDVLLVSLTFRHISSQGCGDLVQAMGKAWRHMMQSKGWRAFKRRWGVEGYVRATEVTVGPANGWHPHFHALIPASGTKEEGKKGFPEAKKELQRELLRLWGASLATVGLDCDQWHGVDVRVTGGEVEDYVAKWGHQPTRRVWASPDELAKTHIKRGRAGAGGSVHLTPWDLLAWHAETGSTVAAVLFSEYAAVFKGRSQLRWSTGLRAKVGLGEERTDEELAAELEPADECVYAYTEPEWRAVVVADVRGELLMLGEIGGRPAVVEFLREVVGLCVSLRE